MKKLMILALLAGVSWGFTRLVRVSREEKPVSVPASPQRGGDAAEGYRYLITGDYLKSGLPYNLFLLGIGKSKANFLHRDGLNAIVPHAYTAVKAPNGE